MQDNNNNNNNIINKRSTTNSFLPEPFPTASSSSSGNPTRHWHDAFGIDDAGVDYGPPNEYEDDDDDDDENDGDDPINENSIGGGGGDEEEEKFSIGGTYDLNDNCDANLTTTTTTTPAADNDDIGSSTLTNNYMNIITIEELEEEVDLHARTLESISIKLATLDEEIQMEEEISSSLRNDIQLLNQRKLLLKKRKEKSCKLIEELEGTLQKCVEKLGGLIDGDGFGNDYHEYYDDYCTEATLHFGGDDEMEDGDGIPGELPLTTLANDDASLSTAAAAVNDDDETLHVKNECDQGDSDCQGNVEDPNLSSTEQVIRGKIAWPSTELVHRIHLAAEELPVEFPTWRTNALSMSLLRTIHSEQLLVNVMNVATLENLVKREEWIQSSEGRPYNDQSGGGWVNEADVWGTCLDVYTHVDWRSIFSGFRRVDNCSMGAEQDLEGSSFTTSKYSTTIDPNVTICPYELGGTCDDDQCSYQHLGKVHSRKRTLQSRALHRGCFREGYIRYNNFPKLKLPRSFTREDLIVVEPGIASMNERDSTSLSVAGTHPINGRCIDEGHVGDVAILNSNGIDTSDEGHQRYYYQVGMDQNHSEEVDARLQQGGSTSFAAKRTTASFRGEESECDLSDDVDGLEFIALPPTITDRAEREIIDNNLINGYKNSIFNGRFWWQQIASFPISATNARHDTFECMLNLFGFERDSSHGKDGANQALRYIIPKLPSESPLSRQNRIDNILHLSRLIDLSRVLVHMGRDSLALLAMSDYCQSRSYDSFNALIEGASRSIKSLLDSRCSSSIFEVQVNLLVISETLHLSYDESLRGDGAGLGGQMHCIDKLIDQMRFSSSIYDKIATPPIPAGFETLLDTVHRSIPTTNRVYIEEHDEWNSFTCALRSMMEKLVMNLTHIGLNEQLAALYQSTCIGKLLSRLICVASRRHSFVPYLHIIEPIWSSLQPLRQSMSGCKRWLHPDLIGFVVIGPVIFECVAEVIAPPRAGAISRKSTMALDARAFASVTSLDKCVVGILKELNRGVGAHDNERGLPEVLLAPLHSLSATICITLRSFEKAHDRLGRLLSNEISSNDKRRPTVFALSEMIWSQLVQIRMLCPHSSVPLKNVARTTTGTLNEPSLLPHDILIFHREIASKIVGYGIWLWGITLRGDTHMNIISPCFNRKHCAEWEQLTAQILTEDHPQEEGGGRFEIDDCDHSTAVEFHLPNPYSELIGARDDRISVFPESIFLLAKRLISLNLENCALASLPVSIGYQIANLRLLNISHNLLSELPASLLHMSSLEHLDVSYNKLTRLPTHMSKCVGLRILDVSYNQLESVPSDLALQCQNLQTLLLDGNPAITTGRMAS